MTNRKINCTCQLAEQMRAFVPLSGCEFRKLMLVELQPGERVAEHQHSGHTVLYYPDNCGPVTIEPTRGMMIYLPPMTLHSVPIVESNRASIAMVVDEL